MLIVGVVALVVALLLLLLLLFVVGYFGDHVDEGLLGVAAAVAALLGGDESAELALLFEALLLEIERHLVDEYVKHNDGDQSGPEVGNDEQYVERLVLRPAGRADGRVLVVAEHVAPAVVGRKEDDDRYEPRGQDHDDDLVGRAPLSVLGGYLDRAEAVNGYEQHGEYRRETHRVVNGQPQVAYDDAEEPLARHQVEREKRHRDEADDEVAHRQREQKVVRRIADLPVEQERDHHQ